MYHNILIATDGSELSARAVEHGVGLARAVGAKVTFLTVTESFHVFSFNADQIEDTRLEFVEHIKARAEHTLAAAGDVASAAGISYDTIHREGNLPGTVNLIGSGRDKAHEGRSHEGL